MKGWNKFDGNEFDWENILVSTGQNILYNQSFWIDLKINEGWKADRLYYNNDKNEIKIILVIFRKKLIFFNYLWSSGGFSNCKIDYLEDSLVLLKNYLHENYKYFYFRMNSVDLFSAEKNFIFSKHLFTPKVLLSSGFTIINNLSLSLNDILNNLNSKKRYTLKSAIKQDIKWEIGLSDKLIENTKSIFNEFKLRSEKNFKIPTSFEIDILSKQKNHFIFIVGVFNNTPATCAIINLTSSCPMYLYAATTEEGRKIGASYAMICELHKYLYSLGFANFDLLGISPADIEIAGINKFKFTFSGIIAKYNGEWEYASKIFKNIGNIIVKIRN